MEIKKLLSISLVTTIMVFASLTPISKIVLATDTYNVDIYFRIIGNMSIEVSPASYNFTQIYANSSVSTNANTFEIWNNGTVDNLTIDTRITANVLGDLTCSESGPPTLTDSYALQGLKGTIELTPWYKESGYVNLDTDLGKGSPEFFGLKLYTGNVSVNTSWETLTITYRASAT